MIVMGANKGDSQMPLLEEFENSYQSKPTDPAKKILFAVLNDLFGRRGFDNEWDAIDKDIKEELLEENLRIVQQNLV
jgi:hypothetical protein